MLINLELDVNKLKDSLERTVYMNQDRALYIHYLDKLLKENGPILETLDDSKIYYNIYSINQYTLDNCTCKVKKHKVIVPSTNKDNYDSTCISFGVGNIINIVPKEIQKLIDDPDRKYVIGFDYNISHAQYDVYEVE
jgi:hypothetical protein